MTDEPEQDDTPAGEAEEPEAPAGPMAGERLADARREQQITVVEVAKELHLDEPKVRALEQNNFDVLGAPVFAKGHLRKYALLVGVDPDDVLQDYYRLTRSSGMPPVVGAIRKPTREFSPGPWVVAILVILLAALAYWWFVAADRSSGQPDIGAVMEDVIDGESTLEVTDIALPERSVERPAAGSAVDTPPATADRASAQQAAAVEVDDSAQLSPAADTAAPAAQPVAASVQPASGQVRLAMSFSGDCWTEISDANGQRLFFDLGRAGRNRVVTGQAPLSALFGNADNVSLQVNGNDYPIAAADRRGQTARLTIVAP